jgi:hypothetical protein
MKGDRQLDSPEIRRKVPPGFRNRLENEGTQLGREAWQVC